MRVTPTEANELDLRGHTLVVPGCGGLAQLGELCVDALVSTYGLQRVAIVESRHLLPVAMASAFKTPSNGVAEPITTAAELYQSKDVPRLSVLQLRSPAAEGRRQVLAQEILDFASDSGVSSILILASCSSHVKRDPDIRATSELRSVCVSNEGAADNDITPLGFGIPEEELGGASGSSAAVRCLLRGSGLARPLLLLAAGREEASSSKPNFEPPPRSSSQPGVDCLLAFTHEAFDWRLPEELSRAACKRLSRRCAAPDSKLVPPPSWQFAMQAEMMSEYSDPRLW